VCVATGREKRLWPGFICVFWSQVSIVRKSVSDRARCRSQAVVADSGCVFVPAVVVVVRKSGVRLCA